VVAEALERIAALYAIEEEIGGRTANERRSMRQAQTDDGRIEMESNTVERSIRPLACP